MGRKTKAALQSRMLELSEALWVASSVLESSDSDDSQEDGIEEDSEDADGSDDGIAQDLELAALMHTSRHRYGW